MKPRHHIAETAPGSPDGTTSKAEACHAPFTRARSAAALPLTVGAEDIAEFVEKLDRALELRQREQEAFDPGI